MPRERESFASYARRTGRQLGVDEACVLGGVSFGGMLAYQIAVECGAKAVLLIASCTNGMILSRHYRVVERLARFLPDRFLHQRAALGCRTLARLEGLDAAETELVQLMAQDVSVPFLRRAGRMVLRWTGQRRARCPVYALHGSEDRVIPVDRVQPTEVLPGAGHLLCLTHAAEMTRFIENALEELTGAPAAIDEVSSMAG